MRIFLKNIRRRERGQALIEFVIVAPLLLLLFFACMYFGNLHVAHQKTVGAARFVAWKSARNPDIKLYFQQNEKRYPISAAKQEAYNYFFAGEPFVGGQNKLVVSSSKQARLMDLFGTAKQRDDFLKSKHTFDPVYPVFNFINAAMDSGDNPMRYGMNVSWSIPLKMGTLDLSDVIQNPPLCTSEHWIAGGPWSGHDTEVNEVLGLATGIIGTAVKTAIKGLFSFKKNNITEADMEYDDKYK